MDSKGQLSAEYLFLVLVILVIMVGVTIPYLIIPAIGNAQGVSKASDMKNAVSNIANAVNLVYANGPSSKRTINIYTPQGTIYYDNNVKQIGMFYNSTRNITASTNYQVTPTNIPVNKGWHQVEVTWPISNGNTLLPITVTFLT